MFLDERAQLEEAGQGLRRAAWPPGWYLRLARANGGFGYELIDQRGVEECSRGWWHPSPSDLAASDWYFDRRYAD